MATANRITRNAVRRFLQNNFLFEGMRLADMQVYVDIDQAYAVMVSKNHVVYEVDMKWSNGEIFVTDMDIMVKKSETPERFRFLGKEFRL